MELRRTTSRPAWGEPRAEYRRGGIASLLVLLLFGGFFGVMFWLTATSTPRDIVLAGFMGVMFLAILGVSAWVLVGVPTRLRLYDEGMRVEGVLWREEIAWDALDVVKSRGMAYQGMPILQLALRTRAGRWLAFGDMPGGPASSGAAAVPRIGIDQLIEIITEASAPARLQACLERYDRGLPLDFGKLKLSRAGLHAGGQVLRWAMLADIQADSERMLVKAVGHARPWQTFVFAHMPNADLLPAVIAHIHGAGFSAFREGQDRQQLEAAGRAHLWRQRLLYWLLLPVLAIAFQLSLNYGRYYFGPQGYRDRGQAAFERGDYPTALREFSQVLALGGAASDAYVDRGRAYAELGLYAEALEDFQTALAMKPNDFRAIGQRGRVRHLQGRDSEAIQDYNRALFFAPNYAFAYCGRGESLQQLGQLAAAKADYIACRGHASTAYRRAEAERLLAGLK